MCIIGYINAVVHLIKFFCTLDICMHTVGLLLVGYQRQKNSPVLHIGWFFQDLSCRLEDILPRLLEEKKQLEASTFRVLLFLMVMCSCICPRRPVRKWPSFQSVGLMRCPRAWMWEPEVWKTWPFWILLDAFKTVSAHCGILFMHICRIILSFESLEKCCTGQCLPPYSWSEGPLIIDNHVFLAMSFVTGES